MNRKNFRTDIQGLRAIAVLAVVGFHAFPSLVPGGFIGVDIFFVISGYVISKNILEAIQSKRFSLTKFYFHRIQRIFPSLVVVLACVSVFGWLYLLPSEFAQLGKHVAGAAAFIENILYLHGEGYFDEGSLSKPLLQLWSLGVEEQFYIAWPIFLLLLRHHHSKIMLAVTFTTAISFIWSLYGGSSSSSEAFFLVHSRIWEFGLGALLVHLRPLLSTFKLKNIVGEQISNYYAYAGVFLLAVGLALIKPHYWFPGWWALLPTFGAFLVILGNPESAISRRLLSNPLLVWFGNISYPLYLWHWVLLSCCFIVSPDFYTRSVRISLVVLSIFLSWATYRVVELPLRNGSKSTAKVSLLIASMVALLVAGLSIYRHHGYPNRYFALHYAAIESAINDWQFPQGAKVITANGREYYSTSERPPVVAFIGDSHISQFGPRIIEQYKKGMAKESVFIVYNGCPPIPNVFEDKHPNCASFTEEIEGTLAALPTIDTLVVAACWNCYLLLETKQEPDVNNFNYVYRSADVEEYFRKGRGAELALKSLEDYLSALKRRYRVILITDNQMSERNDPRQLIRNRLTLQNTDSLQDHEAINADQRDLSAKMQIMGHRLGVEIIDPLTTLCPAGICPIFSKPGIPIFKDNHHLRSSFVLEHASFIDPFIRN